MRNQSVRCLLGMLLILVLLVVFPMTVSAADGGISIIVDGTELVFDVPPSVINERTMVPMRKIFEFLGAEVEWIQEESGIRATTDTLHLYMQLGNPEMTINGVVHRLDVAPTAIDGRTLVPLRAVAEAFMADVTWVQATMSVIIQTPAGKQVLENEQNTQMPDEETTVPSPEDEKYAQALDRTADEVFDSHHLRTSYDNIEYVDLSLRGSNLIVRFMTTDPKVEEFAVRINKGQLVGIKAVKTGRECAAVVKLNELDIPDHAMLEIYTRETGDTLFKSYVYRCLFLDKSGNSYCFSNSRMWEHNQEILAEWVDPRTFLSDDIPEAVVELSNTICVGITDDYEKLLAIHDWVAENMYYDMDDYYNTGSHTYAGVEDMLVNKHSVCQGYADLLTLLVRAQGIPCRQVVGYALGLSATGYWTDDNVTRTQSNHAWNQAYVDHRWVNIDATWDSDNVYENGEYVYGGIDYHLYFDISNLFLSYNHKILSIK